jgi:DNA invertase Pin-like site-specific DNA recombinase
MQKRAHAHAVEFCSDRSAILCGIRLAAKERLLSTLLAAIADFERDLIREGTGDGRKRAMAAGVKFGRKRKLSEYQWREAIKRRTAGETLAAIAKSYGVDMSMISRL